MPQRYYAPSPNFKLTYIDEKTGKPTIAERVLDVHSGEVEAFLKILISEVYTAFGKPKWFHLGADEVNLYGFRLSPEDQTTFLHKMEAYVRDELGAIPMIWNAHHKAHANGGLSSGIVQHWAYDPKGSEPEVYFQNKNLKHINSLGQHYYLDMQQYPDEARGAGLGHRIWKRMET